MTGNPDDLVLALGALAVALIAIGTLVRAVWRLVRSLWRLSHRFDAFFDTWFGLPAAHGRPAVPGIPERVRRLEIRIKHVQEQVTPNGGNRQTLGDKVVRIGEQLGTDHGADHGASTDPDVDEREA